VKVKVSREKKILLATLTINFILAVLATKIFSDGYPLGMDTFSHLPKTLYLSTHGFTQWFFDWYCGFPYLISYAPLAYILTYSLSIFNINPLLSYKLTETIFLMLTPIVFYKLVKTLGFSGEKAAYATLFFTVFPSTIQNPIIFGRFTNIVSYPFFILTLIFVFKTLNCKRSRWKNLFFASIFFGLTVLTHHFSAYILLLTMAILFLTLIQEKTIQTKILTVIAKFFGIAFLGCVFSGFWLLPFYLYREYWVLTYTKENFLLLVSITLFVLMVVLVGITVKKLFKPKNFNSLFVSVWMIIFIVLGSGLLPLKYFLPLGGEVDFLRFQLYLAIPSTILLVNLKNYSFGRLGKKLSLQQKLDKPKIWILVFLILNVLTVGILFQVFPVVLAEEVYPEDPPPQLIQYIKGEKGWGRILPIDCPFWVYILPYQTGKPLVDGWYPQGCILPTLKSITKKTINHYSKEEALKNLIANSKTYGIKWVIVGNHSKLYLFNNSTFKKVLKVSRFTVYKNSLNITYIETNPKTKVKFWQKGDSILIAFKTNNNKTRVLVREAYFPGWFAYEKSEKINVQKDGNGFICFNVYGVGEHRIRLTFNPYKKILGDSFPCII